eukprot:2045624-Rhodomonas_salina.1
MSSTVDGAAAGGQGGGNAGNAGAGVVGGVYAVERLLAAVLLTTSGPGALSQWLAMVRIPALEFSTLRVSASVGA